MSRLRKILDALLSGSRDSNIRFKDLQRVLTALGFEEHVRGDHFIYSRDDVVEIINLQPIGSKAKAYQVKQVRQLLTKYRLGSEL